MGIKHTSHKPLIIHATEVESDKKRLKRKAMSVLYFK